MTDDSQPRLLVPALQPLGSGLLVFQVRVGGRLSVDDKIGREI